MHLEVLIRVSIVTGKTSSSLLLISGGRYALINLSPLRCKTESNAKP